MAVIRPFMSNDLNRPESVVGEGGAFLYWVNDLPMARLHRVFYLKVGLRRDVRVRVAHFRPLGTALGTLVLMHGRTEFIEKYASLINHYVSLGFIVVTFDWRGQGLSTRAIPSKPRKGHIHDFEAYVRDLQIIMERAVLPDCPLPLYGLAHSMGGLIALHFMVRKPVLFDRVILTAPLLRYNVPNASHKSITRLSAVATWLGLAKRYAPGTGDTMAGTAPFRSNPVTSDEKQYGTVADVLDAHPDLGLGGPTVGWLHQMAKAMRSVWDQNFLDQISTPCLFVQAGEDMIVSPDAIERIAAAVPTASLLRLPRSKHEPMFERDEIRELFLSASEAFFSVPQLRKGNVTRSLENFDYSVL
ncbi:MAG: alpha/beta hydrolase [Pseudomonadota bacterium]